MNAPEQIPESGPAELGPGWGEEIVRRIRAVELDESRLVPGAEVAARVREALRVERSR